MKDITEILEAAGFENVESFCNTYTARVPGTKIIAIITVSDKEIHYNGSFYHKFKKPKNLENLFREIIEIEKKQSNNHDGEYDAMVLTSDGKMYMYYNGELIIVDHGNKTTIVVDGKKYTVDVDAEHVMSIIDTYDNKDQAIEQMKIVLNLI